MVERRVFLWTEDRIEAAARLWKDGAPREAIAMAVGCTALQFKYFLTQKHERFPPRRVVQSAQDLSAAEIALLIRNQEQVADRKTLREICDLCNIGELYADRPWSFDRFVRARSRAVCAGNLPDRKHKTYAPEGAEARAMGTGLTRWQDRNRRLRLRQRCLTCAAPTPGLYCENHVRDGLSRPTRRGAIV